MHGNVSKKHMAKKSKTATRTSGARTASGAKNATGVKKAPGTQKGKWVYTFGDGKAEGRADMRDLLGGKGAGLAEMANLGLPVPPGFTITTEVCTYYYANEKNYPAELADQVAKGLAHISLPRARSWPRSRPTRARDGSLRRWRAPSGFRTPSAPAGPASADTPRRGRAW